MFKRFLEAKLPKRSYFLFGPRQVGKSTLLKNVRVDFFVDLLNPEAQLTYSKNPNLLLQEVEALKKRKATVFIDEVQRVPKLLDIVHALIERYPEICFMLCGSSARKLRHGASNLLGGRALYRTLHPLSIKELGNHFKLNWILSYGSLPRIYSLLLSKKFSDAQDLLRSYVITYLREEVKAEALVRNIGNFQNFLDVAVAQYSEQVNFSAVSRDCQVALSTVKEFYSILEDTLIGYFLYPYARGERKRMSKQPKFYFFDNGVTRALLGTLKDEPSRMEKGRLFEQWVIQEIIRLNDYEQNDWKFSFWRTAHGAEVDLLIRRGTKILYAIECKLIEQPASSDLTGLKSFNQNHPEVPCFLVAPVKRSLQISFVKVVNPKELLALLK